MASKIILLDDRFPQTGEPTVQPVVLWGANRAHRERLSKEASASPAYEYIRNIEPVIGRTIVLVIGLGSYEFYGMNRNGDGFNEQPYKPGKSNGQGRDAWVMESECIQHHFQSYENGHVFRHHANKNPKNRVGEVLKAFWNPYMHRVEILEDIDNAKAPDLVERIGDGEYLAKSMGCKIPFDVCSACGNKAPTRKQYCDHLKWQMNHLDPRTGVRYGALNPSPKFFDSSWVIRPADRCGFMLKKVAETAHPYELVSSYELGELVDDLKQKSAAADKLSAIDKVVQGYPAAVVSGGDKLVESYRNTALPSIAENTQELSHTDLAPLTPYKLIDTLQMLSNSGIILTTPEFIRLFIEKALPGKQIPRGVLDRIVALQTEVLGLFKDHPTLLDQTINSMGDAAATPPAGLKEAVAPLLEKRSTVSDYLRRRLVPQAWRHDEAPTTDMLYVQGPEGTPTYATTRGAAQAARDTHDEANLKRLLGGGALMGGAAKVMSMPGKSFLSLPIAGAGLFLGQSGLQDPKSYTTTSGEKIPVITEMQKQSSVFNLVNTLGLEYGVTKQGSTVLARVAQQTAPQHSLRLFLDKHASYGTQYPALTLSRVIEQRDKTASDGITDEQLNFDKVAEVIGELITAAT